ncbi:MAG: hypothetical protein PVF83_00015 [Anaerolineales bacterium]|jgi:hypothetical protein
MYLPKEIPNAKVLITVKTYPRPTLSYEEIVCTAGILETGEWIRIYPIPFRDLPYERQFKKFHWIQVDLTKSDSDDRRESYKPKRMFEEELSTLDHVGTKNECLERKRFVLQEVFASMKRLIDLAYTDNKSLATLKPLEITGFVIEEEGEREWNPKYTNQLNQMKLFDSMSEGFGKRRSIVRKLPYRYYYQFLTNGDQSPRKMQIFDWEIGALFWNCLQRSNGNENTANKLVRQKYFEEFVNDKDLYFLLDTTYEYHKMKVPNPFTVIGVFAPPKTPQLLLNL